MNKLYTLPEVAEITQIPVGWFYERSRRDELPGQVRIGKYIRITEEGLRELAGGRKAVDD